MKSHWKAQKGKKIQWCYWNWRLVTKIWRKEQSTECKKECCNNCAQSQQRQRNSRIGENSNMIRSWDLSSPTKTLYYSSIWCNEEFTLWNNDKLVWLSWWLSITYYFFTSVHFISLANYRRKYEFSSNFSIFNNFKIRPII